MKFLLQLFLVLISILVVSSCFSHIQRVLQLSGIFPDEEFITENPIVTEQTTTTKPVVSDTAEEMIMNIYGEQSLPFFNKCFEYNTRQPKSKAEAKEIARCCNNEYVLLMVDERLGIYETWDDYFRRCN